MGVELGKNVVAMYVNDKDGRCDYVIIINTETGERIQVNLTQDAENKKNFAKVADRILKYGKLDGHDN
jgi:predicted Fe-Mo cluster-binding NifX family protein